MVERLHGPPLFVYGALVAAHEHKGKDGVYERSEHVDVVIDGDFYDLMRLAGVGGVDFYRVEAGLVAVPGIAQRQADETAYGLIAYGDGACNPVASAVSLLLAGNGVANGEAGRIADTDTGLHEAGDIYDAENDEEEERHGKGELHKALRPGSLSAGATTHPSEHLYAGPGCILVGVRVVTNFHCCTPIYVDT